LLPKDTLQTGIANEVWKPVAGYEGLYEVSNQGRVRSVDREILFTGRWGHHKRKLRGVVLKPLRHTGGYQRIMLWKDGSAHQTYVHKLVLEAFAGFRPLGMQVAHANGNKHDNGLSNLRWATPSENQADRIAHGTAQTGKPRRNTPVGREKALAMRTAYTNGRLTITEVARQFGVPRTTAASIINNKVWRAGWT
jgi:hypothetical protein